MVPQEALFLCLIPEEVKSGREWYQQHCQQEGGQELAGGAVKVEFLVSKIGIGGQECISLNDEEGGVDSQRQKRQQKPLQENNDKVACPAAKGKTDSPPSRPAQPVSPRSDHCQRDKDEEHKVGCDIDRHLCDDPSRHELGPVDDRGQTSEKDEGFQETDQELLPGP